MLTKIRESSNGKLNDFASSCFCLFSFCSLSFQSHFLSAQADPRQQLSSLSAQLFLGEHFSPWSAPSSDRTPERHHIFLLLVSLKEVWSFPKELQLTAPLCRVPDWPPTCSSSCLHCVLSHNLAFCVFPSPSEISGL